MPDPAEILVKILEQVTTSQTQLIEALLRVEQRQQEHNLALAQAIGENSRFLAQMIERMEGKMAERDLALAEILERVVQTTTRTEQMTARILTELSTKSASH